MATHKDVKAQIRCPVGDENCLGGLSAKGKPGGGGTINNQYKPLLICSETKFTAAGLVCNLSIVVNNPTDHALVNISIPVSVSTVLQGAPLQGAPVISIPVDTLAPGETCVFSVTKLFIEVPGPEGEVYYCLDAAPASGG